MPCAGVFVRAAPRALGHGQALGEQVHDIAPGPPRVPRVVPDAGDHGVVDRRVVEGVQGAAVDRERQSTPAARISSVNASRRAAA